MIIKQPNGGGYAERKGYSKRWLKMEGTEGFQTRRRESGGRGKQAQHTVMQGPLE